MSETTQINQVQRLCIGGPKDGQLVFVEPKAHELISNKAKPPEPFTSQEPAPTKTRFETVRYRAEQMMGGGLAEPLVVFIIDGMATGQALTRLVNFYRPS